MKLLNGYPQFKTGRNMGGGILEKTYMIKTKLNCLPKNRSNPI